MDISGLTLKTLRMVYLVHANSGKVFPNTNGSSLDFNSATTFSSSAPGTMTQGDSLLVTCSSQDTMFIYEIKAGKLKNTIYSKKYGCDYGRYTHRKPNILYASTKENHDIRYMSTHDNKYIRYFKGHEALVCGLEMSPIDDSFLSCDVSGCVRLWDLGSTKCLGVLKTHSHDNDNATSPSLPSVSFDQSGLLFAVAFHTSIRLYDRTKYDQGPFSIFTLESDVLFPTSIAASLSSFTLTIQNMCISNDGKYILVATSIALFLVDAFEGNILSRLTLPAGDISPGRIPPCGFTPDAKFVYAGGSSGIFFWNIESQVCPLVCTIPSAASVDQLLWNPNYFMMASSSDSTNDLTLWVPQINDELP